MIGHNGGPLSEGWIARHRSVRDHWLVGHGIHVKPADPDRKRCHTQGEAWEDLLMECRYADATVSNGGKKMELRRGELIGAVSWLANRWNWTPKTVRRFLDQLENDGMIELRNPASEKGNQIGRQANVVTVCNYDEYQLGIMPERQPKGQPEGSQRATRGQPEGNIYKEEQRNKGTKEQEEVPQTPEGGSVSADAGRLTVRTVAREAFTEWQEFAKAHGLAVPRDSTFDTFAGQVSSRIREHASSQTRTAMLEVWHTALCSVAKSKFLRGLSGQDFKADLGMITRPKNFAKLISGGYGNGAASIDARWSTYPPATPSPAPVDKAAIERARQERIRKAEADGWEFEGGDPNALIG